MTALFDFLPTTVAPYTFQPTLDGLEYTGIVTWNLFGQRWFLNLYKLDGTLVVAEPLIGSPVGLFIETLTWSKGLALATTTLPHGYRIGESIDLTIVGCSPDAYNGRFRCFVVDENMFTYSIPSVTPAAATVGSVGYDINLVAGYFTTSTLVYRVANGQIEVNPG